MTTRDFLVIESHPGASARQQQALEDAGHRVHRCVESREDSFPCIGVTDPPRCPLDSGIDAVLLVRKRVAPEPTAREYGVSCAVRAQVPVVQDGPTILDPFDSVISSRVTGDVVAACEAAVEGGFDSLRRAIQERTAQVLAAAGVSTREVEYRIARRGGGIDLTVTMIGPPLSSSHAHALSVRVLDAVRDDGRTHGRVDVNYETPT